MNLRAFIGLRKVRIPPNITTLFGCGPLLTKKYYIYPIMNGNKMPKVTFLKIPLYFKKQY
jgi:hypothetical protein